MTFAEPSGFSKQSSGICNEQGSADRPLEVEMKGLWVKRLMERGSSQQEPRLREGGVSPRG